MFSMFCYLQINRGSCHRQIHRAFLEMFPIPVMVGVSQKPGISEKTPLDVGDVEDKTT